MSLWQKLVSAFFPALSHRPAGDVWKPHGGEDPAAYPAALTISVIFAAAAAYTVGSIKTKEASPMRHCNDPAAGDVDDLIFQDCWLISDR